MSSSNDTRKVVDEIGRQVFESMQAEETPEQPYFDFLDYREYLKIQKSKSPSADEIFGECFIDGGSTAPSAAYK